MSIKFPKLYKAAAHLLKIASEEDINVKHILYNDKKYHHHNIKSLYAIVAKALKNWDVIETLIKESNITTEHRGLDIWRIRVIVSELVIDQKEFPNPENYTVRTIIQYEEKFKEILLKKQTKALMESDDRSETDVAKVRFIKVNLIQDNVKSVIEKFQEDSWEKLETASNYEGYLQQLRDLEPNSSVFIQDFHFPEVLAFPPGTELQSHELYVNGSVFFMDKSSCLAPFLLAPKRRSRVLDMCAAPGLKTIQLASYVTSGKVYAVERDPGRYSTLQKMVEQSGAGNVITVLQDVTNLDVNQYKHVEYILVDPSCTGSGIRKRQPSAILKARLDEKTRVEKLSGFQLTLLRFALTRFPAAKRVVYSTCSLNVEENEKVVEAALNSYFHNFDVVSVQDKLPGWQNFGSKDFQFGNKCVYCQPEIDQTNGFFVAVFERKKNQSDMLGVNRENRNGKSEKHFKGKKRRIHEENYSDVNELLKISPHKRLKLEYNQAEKNEENKVIATKSLNKGGTQRVKANGKKLSSSEKKRSRKKVLKIKNKLLPQLRIDKNTKVKIKNPGPNDIVEKTDKKKCFSEDSDKISRAKLRYKRSKKFKLSLALGTNASNIPNLSNVPNNLDIQKNSEEDTAELKKKKKKNKIHSSLQENLNESLESKTSSLSKKKKRKEETTDLNKHERMKSKHVEDRMSSFESTETTPSNRDVIDKSINKVSSKIIETDESGDTLKSKRKKNNSLKHQNANIEKSSCIEKNADKFGNPNESYKNIKEINYKSSESADGKTLKKEHKKKHTSNHYDNNIFNHVHDNKSFDKACIVDLNNKTKEEICAESYDRDEKYNKKHKRNHSSDNHQKNIDDNVHDENFDKACIVDANNKTTEDIYTESNDREEKGTHKKKHKKKHSSDYYEKNITDHVHGDEKIDKACIVDLSEKTKEEIYTESNGKKEKHKKKHKKNHSSDYLKSNIHGNVHDESFGGACIVDTSDKTSKDIYTEVNDKEEKRAHKKKLKKNHSSDYYEKNIKKYHCT